MPRLLIKPFRPRELVASLLANLRRTEPGCQEPRVQLDGLEIEPAARAVRRDGEWVHLTPIDALCGRATATAGAQARVGSNTGLDPRVARHLLLANLTSLLAARSDRGLP